LLLPLEPKAMLGEADPLVVLASGRRDALLLLGRDASTDAASHPAGSWHPGVSALHTVSEALVEHLADEDCGPRGSALDGAERGIDGSIPFRSDADLDLGHGLRKEGLARAQSVTSEVRSSMTTWSSRRTRLARTGSRQ